METPSHSHSHPPFDVPTLEITESDVARLVHTFYGRVRKDPLLSPVFGAHVHNWDEHLTTLTDFWSWLLLKKPGFNGNPMPKHMRLEGITWSHFERWLMLFRQTTAELQLPQLQPIVDAMAGRIAATLWENYQKHNPQSQWKHTVPKNLVSYKVSPIFTHENLPAAFQTTHTTKAGTWGLVRVHSGELVFTVDAATPRTILLKAGDTLLVEPEQPHHVTFVGQGSFEVDFHKAIDGTQSA